MSGIGDDGPHLEPGVEDDRSATQRYEFRKGAVLGAVALVGGIALIILGLTTGKNVTLPVLAVAAGVVILVFDSFSARIRRNGRR